MREKTLWDDQMQMVILHAEVHDPKPVVRGRGQRAADVRIHTRGAQATNGRPGAQGADEHASGNDGQARKDPGAAGAGSHSLADARGQGDGDWGYLPPERAGMTHVKGVIPLATKKR